MAFILGSATISGTSSVTADGVFVVLGDASASGVGTVTASADKIKTASASMSGVGTATATGVATWRGHAHADGEGVMLVADFRNINLDEEVIGICDGMVIEEHPPDPFAIIVDQSCD
jgi:hypothetical protein